MLTAAAAVCLLQGHLHPLMQMQTRGQRLPTKYLLLKCSQSTRKDSAIPFPSSLVGFFCLSFFSCRFSFPFQEETLFCFFSSSLPLAECLLRLRDGEEPSSARQVELFRSLFGKMAAPEPHPWLLTACPGLQVGDSFGNLGTVDAKQEQLLQFSALLGFPCHPLCWKMDSKEDLVETGIIES